MGYNDRIIEIEQALICISVVDVEVTLITSLHNYFDALMGLRAKECGGSLGSLAAN